MDTQQLAPLQLNHVNCGLVAGTTSTYTTTVATTTSIGGKFNTSLAAQTNTASPTTDATSGAAFVPVLANNTCMLVWGINAAGAIKLAQGGTVPTNVGVTTSVGDFITAPPFPSLPDDFCPIGYQLVRVTPTQATFTPGTTAWTSGTCTVIKNISSLPGRPQIA